MYVKHIRNLPVLLEVEHRYAAQIIPEFDWRKDAEGRKIRGLNYDLGDHDVLVWDGRGYDIIPAAAVTRKTKHRG